MLRDQRNPFTPEGLQRLEVLRLESTSSNGGRLLTQAGSLEVLFYTPGIIRLRLERSRETDYGLLVSLPDPMDVNVSAEGGVFRFQAREIALDVMSDPLRLRLSLGGRTVLESSTERSIQGDLRIDPFAHGDGLWSISLALESGEPVYGLGEKFGPLNRRGQLLESWNLDALGVNTEASYKNVPFAWSPEGWGLFVHTPARVTHGIGYPQWSHHSYILNVDDPNLDIFLLAGSTPADILRMYTLLTGCSPLPPRWSFGVWMSRAYYRTAEEALHVARTLRERNIPCDVMVLDGRAWHKPKLRFDFTWDEERYPDPARFVKELKDLNIRLYLWEYPYVSSYNPLFSQLAVKGYLLRTASGDPYIHRWFPEALEDQFPHLPPSGILDLTNPDAYRWYRDAHQDLFAIGVSAMKTDYGEAVPEDAVAFNGDSGKRLHNVYPLLYNRCAYEASHLYGQGEAVVWGRSGWSGSQRYPVQWGGDPQSDWEGLAASIRGGLSWGMSGGPFYSHDIGGFAANSGKAEASFLFYQRDTENSQGAAACCCGWSYSPAIASHRYLCRFHSPIWYERYGLGRPPVSTISKAYSGNGPTRSGPLQSDSLRGSNLHVCRFGCTPLIGVSLSTLIGCISGYFGGKTDMVIQRLVDAVMCFPGLIIMLTVIAVTGPGLIQVILVLGILGGIGGQVRVVRSAVMSIRGTMYVDAAKAVGSSDAKTLLRHILPNVMAPLIILFTTAMGGAILTEATLSFLGYGVPPPEPSWGGMLSREARVYMEQAPWLALWPGLALAAVVWGVNMLGDGLRDVLDPRLMGGRTGRYKVKATKKLVKATQDK